MAMTILGFYSVFMLLLLSFGSVAYNMKKGKNLKFKDFGFMLIAVARILVYVVLTLF